MSLADTSLDDVLDTFDFLDDWEERYRYVIDLGRKLPPLDASEMTDTYKVRGCQSQVWLVPDVDADGRINLRGDSDAHIVKGLVALMLLIYSGKTPAEILATDARAILDRMGLSAHLSPMRANGLFSMVERIRDMAEAA
ncbi:MAG: SufE family protein [Alphaproteobacteria bacterium]|nr:MAG: SufE family protein [Alphaproteobacteria bacterium]